MKKFIFIFWALFFYGQGLVISVAAEDIQILATHHDAQLNYKLIEEGKLLVSVKDAHGEPIRGLTSADFAVGRGIQRAKILSAESLESIKEIPLNIVLVVDNSFSMSERKAVKPLLSALDGFFSTVRPIDNMHLVVFDDDSTTKFKQIALHTKTFSSSNISKLKSFLEEAYGRGLAGKTYLYEAMLAGLDLVRKMPESDHKFLVVFSDGEDLNSKVSTAMIESEAQGISNFEAFCVDYMPGKKPDRFLTSFAKNHAGRIWKATSSSELFPIFKAFTTTLLYRYLITYQILDPLIVDPDELNFDLLTLVDGNPIKNFIFFETGKSEIRDKYVQFKDPLKAKSFDETSLDTAREKYLNIMNLIGKNLVQHSTVRAKIIGCNSNVGVEKDNLDLSQRRAEAVRTYLNEYWGIDNSRMTVEARNLPQQAAPMNLIGARAENQRVEIVYDSAEMQAAAAVKLMVEAKGNNQINVHTHFFTEVGFSDWQLTVSDAGQPLKTVTGTDDIDTQYVFSLSELDMNKLVAINQLGIKAEVIDSRGKAYETPSVMLPVTVSKNCWVDELIDPPQGSVNLEPKTVTIEELTTIDSSPFLNYIYFDEGDSDIRRGYALFSNQADTKAFDEANLTDTMEKHHNILNIIGRRLLDHSDARVRIVGCNSNQGVESGKIDLSRSRAEAVKAYLRYIWGIEPSRMEVEARNLPAVASTGSLSEGRAENQRVEIMSDSSALLDVIKSTYVQEICNVEQFHISPQIQSGYEITRWTITLTGDGQPIGSLEGQGDLEQDYYLMIKDIGLGAISSRRTITANIEVTDRKGKSLKVAANSNVQFIKRKERLAQKMGYRVLEKYALILFDFNRSDIKEHNKEIVNRIVARIKEIPTAMVNIVGHTDTIGNEDYNLVLSTKRAKAAYDQILAGGVPAGENIAYKGIGPHDSLFDNELPEGRALNRTVTVTLEYESKD
ncbi:MAG: OmpA family protein [Deltaproteobacteria bacterium]|nr:OmpA family protein [Deltaproteobacteria bacterium]